MYGIQRFPWVLPLCALALVACDDRGYSRAVADGSCQPSGGAAEPIETLCDGVDNDCDGAIDEGMGVGEICEENGGGCVTLRRECQDGVAVCAPDHTIDDGLPCEDLCSVGGVCQDGQCVGSTPLVCEDGDACTADRCDPARGCVHSTAFTPACCDLALEPVGGANLFGRGRVEDVEVIGNLAYLAAGRVGLHIYDVRDPAAPTQVGWLDTPGDAFRLDVEAGLVYLGDQASGPVETAALRVIDATDPARPRLLGSAEPQYLLKGVEVQGDYVYTVSFGGEFRVVDVSDPTDPRTVASLYADDPAHWDAWDLSVQGERAYVSVSGGQGHLEVYDISDPTSPALLSRSPTYAYPHGMFVHKERAYISQYGRLKVFDIGVERPRQIADEGGDFGRGAFVDDTHLYIAGSRGFRTYDATAPRPTLLATRSTPEDTKVVRVLGGFAYVGIGEGAPLILNPSSGGSRSAQGGLWTYDVSDPADPTRVGQTFTPGAAHDVVVVGRHAYVADLGGGLRVFDVANPAAPTQVAHVENDSVPFAVEQVGQRLVVGANSVGGTDILVYDIGRPSTPTLSGSTTLDGIEVQLVADGSRLYATTKDAADYMTRVHVLEVDGGVPRVLGYVDPGRYTGDVAPYGDLLYVSGEMLRVLDISDPSAPTVVSQTTRLPASVNLQIDGDTLYGTAGASTSRLWVWDLSQPLTPTLVGESDFPNPGTSISLRGGFAFVANGVHGVRVFDVSDPASPTDVGSFPTVGHAWGIDVPDGNIIYVADTYGLLQTARMVCR